MERGRKNKIITIVALVVAIVTMSLGFAVFSNVLTISSSATVKPNAEDYVVNIYGLSEEIPENFGGELSEALSYFTSTTTSVPWPIFSSSGGNISFSPMVYDAQPAIIDNKNFTISNINVTFSDSEQAVHYLFQVKNEGKNSVYINMDNITWGDKSCVAKEGTSQELVDVDCAKILGEYVIVSSLEEVIYTVSSYEIVPGDYVVLLVVFGSNNDFVSDGEFIVNFDDLKIEFSSLDNSQSS